MTTLVLAQTPGSWDEASGPKAVTVVFKLEPDSATVWRRTTEGRVNYLGRSGERVTIGLNPLEAKGERELLLEFRVPLWFGEWVAPPEFFSAQDLAISPSYPKSGIRKLDLSLWQRAQAWTRMRPFLSVGLLLALFGVPIALRVMQKAKLSLLRTEPLPLMRDHVLLEKIGEGGMGEVYKAQDSSGELCAVKLLRPMLSEGVTFRQQFDREQALNSKLSHPNLLKVEAYGSTTDGRSYMVTELLIGETLKERLRKKDLHRPRLAAEVVEQIGAALIYLHSQDLVHQDVKPSNIFVCDNGELKLLDLGIVASLREETKSGQVVGTPLYMAPEQFEGKVTALSDQYAMGLVLYEVLTGQRPSQETNAVVLAQQRSQGPASLPSEVNSVITSDVNECIGKMLEPDPSRRFSSFQTLREPLAHALLEQPWGSQGSKF